MNGNDILEILKTWVSEKEYFQYISKIHFDQQDSNENKLVFSTPNIFITNWARQNYTEKIMQIIEQKYNKKIEVSFTSQHQVSQAHNTQKRYLIKNNQAFTNAEQRFDNFIVGECNCFAFESAKVVAYQQTEWNPLLIYGNTGLGKTHLLNAISNAVFAKNPNANIIYITAETMFNEYRHRISHKTMDQFRERFRKCDYLLIDDVQFLSNTDKFQEEFFNTFNDIVKTGGKIVMTSDKTPNHIDKLEKRLKSRFNGGLTTKIESPELNTKIDIIRKKCELNNIALDSEIINFLATQFYDNIREIEGIIASLYSQMSILNIDITLDIAKQVVNVLQDKESEKGYVNFDTIIHEIAITYNIKPSEIRTKVRGKKNIAKARKIVAYIARNEINATLPYIASELNLKDHSAVSKQIKSLISEMQKDTTLKNEIQNLISKLKQDS